jgi:hypothetical protein
MKGNVSRLIITPTLLAGLCESLNLQHHNDDYVIVCKPDQYMLPVNFKRVQQQNNNNNFDSGLLVMAFIGRAIAQAVSRLLPTAAARVQTRVWSCGIL